MGLIEGTNSRVTKVNLEAIQGSSVLILHSPVSLSLPSLLPPPPLLNDTIVPVHQQRGVPEIRNTELTKTGSRRERTTPLCCFFEED